MLKSPHIIGLFCTIVGLFLHFSGLRRLQRSPSVEKSCARPVCAHWKQRLPARTFLFAPKVSFRSLLPPFPSPPPFSFFPLFSLPKVSFRSLLLPSSLPTSLPFPPVKGLFWKKYLPRVTGRFSALFPARPSTRLQCFRALAGARCVCRAAGGCG